MPSRCGCPSARLSVPPPRWALATISHCVGTTAKWRLLCSAAVPRQRSETGMNQEAVTLGADTTGLSFEEALARLEDVVARLETGTLSLDESLREYEQGVALSRHCALYLRE